MDSCTKLLNDIIVFVRRDGAITRDILNEIFGERIDDLNVEQCAANINV